MSIFLGVKAIFSFSLSIKFGQVDRGRCTWRSLPKPGADEEQPVGGERQMHPPLGRRHPSPPELPVSTVTPADDPWSRPGLWGQRQNSAQWALTMNVLQLIPPPSSPHTHTHTHGNKGTESHISTSPRTLPDSFSASLLLYQQSSNHYDMRATIITCTALVCMNIL